MYCRIKVAGESFHKANLESISNGRQQHAKEYVATLKAEPTNPYDKNAVSVWIKGLKVGYINRIDASRYRDAFAILSQKGVNCSCTAILNGTPTSFTGLGVTLKLYEPSVIRYRFSNNEFDV